MRWLVEERLRRTLPYGCWKWQSDDGSVIETIFNRRYQPLATRVDGGLVAPSIEPPKRMYPEAYFFRIPPWRNGETATRERCRQILRDWGIDPVEAEARAAAELREERRLKRRSWRR